MTFKDYILRKICIGENVDLGSRFHVGFGSRIWAPSRLVVGDDVYVGRYSTIEVDGSIGDGCLIANNVGIIGRQDHDVWRVGVPARRAPWVGDHPTDLSIPTHLEEDVWVGFGAVILSGVRIGRSAIVGAGALVVRDVAPGSVAAGVPARPVGARFRSDSELRDHWERCGFFK